MRHNLTRRWVTSVALGATLAWFPLAGFPLGLGKLKVHSALNAPLDAEIEITSITETELKGLNVTLAARADFEAAGAERYPFLSSIKFTPIKRPDGRYALHLSTEQQFDEPFLHLLIKIEWSGGRLVRQYTALIDPPQFAGAQPGSIEPPQSAPLATAPPPEISEPAPEPAQLDDVASMPPTASEPSVPVETEAPPPSVSSEPERPADAPVDESAALMAETPPPQDVLSEPAMPPGDTAASGDAVTPSAEPLAAEADVVDSGSTDAAAADAATVGAASGEIATLPPPGEYLVQRGDTLSLIADAARPNTEISREQMVVALYRNNPKAFFRKNMNNLRAGSILMLPSVDEAATIDPAEARRELRAHYSTWQEHKLALAAARRAVPTTGTGDVEAVAPSEAPVQATTPATPTNEEPLRIVRSDLETKQAAPASGSGESAVTQGQKERDALAERVATLEESIESRQIENKELNEKIGLVRGQLKSETRLIELENESLARQVERPAPVQAEPPAATPTPAPVVVKPLATAQPPAPVVVEPSTPAPSPAPSLKKAPPPLPNAPVEKDFIATLIENLTSVTLLPVLFGFFVIAGGVIFSVYWRRRRRSIAEFEESILQSDAISSEPVSTNSDSTTGAATSDASFMSDFSKGGMGHAHTDEVDPIAEAEVYIAYGRDETAEEILKEAMTKQADRHEIKLKLLEIYHRRSDLEAFETLAEELYAAVGVRGGALWTKVEAMGSKLNPKNPLFRGGAPSARQAPPAASAAPTAEAESLEFDVATSDPEKAASTEIASKPSLDFNLETSPSPLIGAMDRARASGNAVTPQAAEGSIDFDATLASAVETDAPAAPGESTSTIEWNSTSPPAAQSTTSVEQPQWDEVATKLDLARAYIDMGDSEGARSILDEVLAEGNENQKQQAAQLAAQIG